MSTYLLKESNAVFVVVVVVVVVVDPLQTSTSL